jgi:type II secretory pathway pseudopilin PulG
LFGVLDDDEQQEVDARLAQDPEYAREFAMWRRRLATLESLRPEHEPPPGLADRACRLVQAHRATNSSKWRGMNPVPCPPSWISQVRWLDVSAVAILLAAVAIVLFPAISNSRFQARRTAHQESLHQYGMALSQYQQQNDGRLSVIPPTAQLQHASRDQVVANFVESGFFIHDEKPSNASIEPVAQPLVQAGPAFLSPSFPNYAHVVLFAVPQGKDDRRASMRIAYVSHCISRPSSAEAETTVGKDISKDIGDDIAISSGPLPLTSLQGNSSASQGDAASPKHSDHGWNVLFEDNHTAFCSPSLQDTTTNALLSNNTFSPANLLSPNSRLDW